MTEQDTETSQGITEPSHELLEAMQQHQARTGKSPDKLRVSRPIWNDIVSSMEDVAAFTDNQERPQTFRGAAVEIIENDKNPNGYFRYSMK